VELPTIVALDGLTAGNAPALLLAHVRCYDTATHARPIAAPRPRFNESALRSRARAEVTVRGSRPVGFPTQHATGHCRGGRVAAEPAGCRARTLAAVAGGSIVVIRQGVYFSAKCGAAAPPSCASP
jgi:hypothetical protein